jgi:hypothetical protein
MSIQQGATNAFKIGLPAGIFNFATDTFKIALYTGAATLGPTTDAYTPENEVVASGYAAGGEVLVVSVQPTTGPDPSSTTVYLSFSNVSWTSALTARGALIYKVGGTNPTVCVLNFGGDKTSVNTFTVEFPVATSTSAILRLS